MGGFAPTGGALYNALQGNGLLEAILRRRGLSLPTMAAPPAPLENSMNQFAESPNLVQAAPQLPVDLNAAGGGGFPGAGGSLVTDMVRMGAGGGGVSTRPTGKPIGGVTGPMIPPPAAGGSMQPPVGGLPTGGTVSPARGRVGASPRKPKRKAPAPATERGTRGPISMY